MKILRLLIINVVCCSLLAACNPYGGPNSADESFGATGSDTSADLDLIDDDGSLNGFGGGTNKGTIYANGALTLNTTTNNSELDKSWTPKWESLISYWKLEGDLNDSIGTNHGSYISGATHSAIAKVGSSSLQTGQDNTASANMGSEASLDFNGDFSLSVWFRPIDIDGTLLHDIISKRLPSGGWALSMLGTWNGACGSVEGSVYLIRDAPDATNRVCADAVLNGNTWYHLVVSYHSASTTSKVYVNGNLVLNDSSAPINFANDANLFLGQRSDLDNCCEAIGMIDEAAIFSTVLLEDEVQIIYSRQSTKYSGEFTSRVIDSKSSLSNWQGIDWMTKLPYGKELTDISERPADYSDLSEELSDDLVGLWHLNEPSYTGAANEVRDSSGNNLHGLKTSGTVNSTKEGVFAGSAEFPSSGAAILKIPGIPESGFVSSDNWSVAAWFQVYKSDNNMGKIFNLPVSNSDWNRAAVGLMASSNGRSICATIRFVTLCSGEVLKRYRWYYSVATFENGVLKLYLDGKEVGSASGVTGYNSAATTTARLGERKGGSGGNFRGKIDEVSLWQKVLKPREILTLYQRGINKIKLQLRTCGQSDCSDQESQTGGGWQGPGGNFYTYFGEIYNNSIVSSSCAIPQACYPSELSLDGIVKLLSPSFNFSDFGGDGLNLVSNRYLQYRVVLESDDQSTTCDADDIGNDADALCLPELQSVESKLE